MSLLQAHLETNYNVQIDTTPDYTKFRWPLWGVVFYLMTVGIFSPAKGHTKQRKVSKDKKRFGKTEAFIFFHNLVLCIFSLLCFINTAPVIFNVFSTYGHKGAICYGFQQENLYQSNYGWWSHLFYLSKFYEFIDTWIVIAKGRKPITLQVYHHTGAVLGMWFITVSQSSAGYLFVVENSFIHTIMYFYYATSVLGIKFRGKFIITILQMAQFVTGLSLLTYQLLTFGECVSVVDKVCHIYHLLYVGILFVMFYNFYNATYHKKSKAKANKSK